MYLEDATSPIGAAGGLPSVMRQPTQSLQSLFDKRPIERFDAGATVFWEGDAAAHVFEVVEGLLRVCRILNDGRRVITGFLYPGDLVGVSHKDLRLSTAETITRTRLRRLGRDRFQDTIDQSPELRAQLFTRLCDEIAAAQDQLVLLARRKADERVGSFLLVIARRLSGARQTSSPVEIPMTRLDMADYLGLTIETVSRTMTKLTRRGVIAPSGRRAIRILEPAKLAALAGEIDEGDNRSAAIPSTRQAVWPH